jgi:hypothetical protein
MSAVSAAAQSTPEPESLEHPLRGGAWAFQFQGFLLSGRNDFGGVELGVKNHLSPRSALQVAFGVDIQSSDLGERAIDEGGFERESLRGSETENRAFELSTLFLFYPDPGPSVNLFLAAGPFVQWAHSEDADVAFTEEPTRESMSVRQSDFRSRTAGARVEIGFEWFLARRVGLITTYGLAVSHTKSERTESLMIDSTEPNSDRVSNFEREGSATRVNTTAVGLGFSVYF